MSQRPYHLCCQCDMCLSSVLSLDEQYHWKPLFLLILLLVKYRGMSIMRQLWSIVCTFVGWATLIDVIYLPGATRGGYGNQRGSQERGRGGGPNQRGGMGRGNATSRGNQGPHNNASKSASPWANRSSPRQGYMPNRNFSRAGYVTLPLCTVCKSAVIVHFFLTFYVVCSYSLHRSLLQQPPKVCVSMEWLDTALLKLISCHGPASYCCG